MSSYPDPEWTPPPPPPRHNSRTVGMAFAGIGIYSLVNLVSFWTVVVTVNDRDPQTTALVYAIVLALVTLGTGAGLLFLRRPWAKGLGLGLMMGWGLWTIFSAGICTGINPIIYS